MAIPAAVTSTTQSVTVAVSQNGGNLAYPAGDGYAAAILTSSNDAPAGTIATLTTITNPPTSLAPMDPPPGTRLVAYELTLNQTVTFKVWNGFVSSVSLPTSVQPAGHAFADYGYDLTVGVASGSDPGTVSGSTVTFPAGRFAVTLKANHIYAMIVAMQ